MVLSLWYNLGMNDPKRMPFYQPIWFDAKQANAVFGPVTNPYTKLVNLLMAGGFDEDFKDEN